MLRCDEHDNNPYFTMNKVFPHLIAFIIRTIFFSRSCFQLVGRNMRETKELLDPSDNSALEKVFGKFTVKKVEVSLILSCQISFISLKATVCKIFAVQPEIKIHLKYFQ